MPAPLRQQDMHLFRHPSIQTGRPYAFDLDDDGRLWEGSHDGLYMHDPRTGTCEHVRPPALAGRFISSVLHFHGRLVIVTGETPDYVTFDPATGASALHDLPGPRPIIWYGCTTAGKLLLMDRSADGGVLVLDEPGGPARKLVNPWGYIGIAGGKALDESTVLMTRTDPLTLVLFDARRERFIEAIDTPYPDAGTSGILHHADRLYMADSTGGRLLVFDLDSRTWEEPIPAPEYGSTYGFIGAGCQIGGVGYFCLSSYRFRSQLDPHTGKLVVHEGGGLGVDGRPHHFLDRFLVFNADDRSFRFLGPPAQPDGYPLICYAHARGSDLFITGYVMPQDTDGQPTTGPGDWLVWQSVGPDRR